MTLTSRGLRWLAIGGSVTVLLLVLGTLGVLPFGLHGVMQRFAIDDIDGENRALRREDDVLVERAGELARVVYATEERCRRLAWTLSGTPDLWQGQVPRPPDPPQDVENLIGWLEAHSARLPAFGDSLVDLQARQPCPLAALPIAPPLDLRQAVPVALFGWRASPFTGKEEAHHGTTLAAPVGEAVLAPGGGTVLFAGEVRDRLSNEWVRFGNIVLLDHGCGVLTVLGHLRDVAVKRGQSVRRGDRVGTVGQTGWTRVPALYLEIRWPVGDESVPVDPALVSLELPMEAPDSRLTDPSGGLPSDYARLDRLVRRR